MAAVPGHAGPVLPPKFHLISGAPPSHLAQVSPPLAELRAGRGRSPGQPWAKPAGWGLRGQGRAGRDSGDKSRPPCLPPCRTVTSYCRPCSPRWVCAPWRCPRTYSWTAGAPKGQRPRGCVQLVSRSRSALASCSWGSSLGRTGRPSPTARPGRPQVGRRWPGAHGRWRVEVAPAGMVVRGPEAAVGPLRTQLPDSPRPALSHRPTPAGVGEARGEASTSWQGPRGPPCKSGWASPAHRALSLPPPQGGHGRSGMWPARSVSVGKPRTRTRPVPHPTGSHTVSETRRHTRHSPGDTNAETQTPRL